MNIPAEVLEKAPQEEIKNLDNYKNKVWELLGAMKPGDVITVSSVSKARNRELFIEVAKWYMREHRDTYMDGLTFTRNFVSIQKYDVAFLMKKKQARA